MHLNGLGGIEMHGLHQPSGLIGANGNHGEIKAAQPIADLGEDRAISRIACKIDGAMFALEHPSTPMGPVAIEETARGAVLSGNTVKGEFMREGSGGPPGQLRAGAEASLAEPSLESFRDPVMHP